MSIKKPSVFVTYLTIYSGNLLPPYYIGSSSKNRVENGYRGSVQSKKYRAIWKFELKENPHLFDIIIISEHEDRKEAFQKELELQKDHCVVKNDIFINMAYADGSGRFGGGLSGKKHPMYGKHHTKESIEKISNSKKGKKLYNTRGKKHQLFSGFYHTPVGTLESTYEIKNYTDFINHQSIGRWCKNPNKIISSISIGKSKYLQSLKTSPLGKTFKEIGFWFESSGDIV